MDCTSNKPFTTIYDTVHAVMMLVGAGNELEGMTVCDSSPGYTPPAFCTALPLDGWPSWAVADAGGGTVGGK